LESEFTAVASVDRVSSKGGFPKRAGAAQASRYVVMVSGTAESSAFLSCRNSSQSELPSAGGLPGLSCTVSRTTERRVVEGGGALTSSGNQNRTWTCGERARVPSERSHS